MPLLQWEINQSNNNGETSKMEYKQKNKKKKPNYISKEQQDYIKREKN